LSAPRPHFRDDHQFLRVRVQRAANNLIGNVRSIEIAGVDVIHASRNRFAQHSDCRVLDQLTYKWAHSRPIIAKVLAENARDLRVRTPRAGQFPIQLVCIGKQKRRNGRLPGLADALVKEKAQFKLL